MRGFAVAGLSELMETMRGSIPHELMEVRDIKGGGQWVYVPWRNLVKVLDLHTQGQWRVSYSDARYLFPDESLKASLVALFPPEVSPEAGEAKASRIMLSKNLCEVKCTIEIEGFERQGVGSCSLVEMSSAGNDGTQGDPSERARASAFRSACEMWGIGVYLHRQKKDKAWQMELIKRVRVARREADQNWIAA